VWGNSEGHETGIREDTPGGGKVVGAQPQRRAGDGLQPLLRFGCQRRLALSVRGAADKAAHLMGCKSPYRQLPDADG